jgi:triosephosphate isomerase
VVAKKVKYALDHGLKVMACVGETLRERENVRTMEVLFSQLQPMAGATRCLVS